MHWLRLSTTHASPTLVCIAYLKAQRWCTQTLSCCRQTAQLLCKFQCALVCLCILGSASFGKTLQPVSKLNSVKKVLTLALKRASCKSPTISLVATRTSLPMSCTSVTKAPKELSSLTFQAPILSLGITRLKIHTLSVICSQEEIRPPKCGYTNKGPAHQVSLSKYLSIALSR